MDNVPLTLSSPFFLVADRTASLNQQVPEQDMRILDALFHEFDMSKIEPELPQISSGDWIPDFGWVNLLA